MSASLVGSEMCIRDSTLHGRIHNQHYPCRRAPVLWVAVLSMVARKATVSYTHLTLPTICSV
eukprot:1095029-Alexandrium_andersonii.AAC.1